MLFLGVLWKFFTKKPSMICAGSPSKFEHVGSEGALKKVYGRSAENGSAKIKSKELETPPPNPKYSSENSQ